MVAAMTTAYADGTFNNKGPSWWLREHQALTQPLAQLNDPLEPPPTRRR